MVPGPAVPGLGVGRVRAVHAGDPLVGVAVPPRDAGEPAPRRDHDGHARVARHHRRLRVVGRRARVPRRGRTGHEHGRRRSAARATARTSTSRPRARSSRCSLLGKYFEARARGRSSNAIRALLELGAKTARLENGDEIPVAGLRVGDRFVVRPGEKVATDGTVVDGASAVDVSMLTGEPVPVDVAAGRRGVRRHAQHRGPPGGGGHTRR